MFKEKELLVIDIPKSEYFNRPALEQMFPGIVTRCFTDDASLFIKLVEDSYIPELNGLDATTKKMYYETMYSQVWSVLIVFN